MLRRARRSMLLLLALSAGAPAFAASSNPTSASLHIVGEKNYLSGYPAIVEDGVINMIVEIPAGTNDKWEVSADGESIHWELEDNRPRVVRYLPYPGNYGMVPRTSLRRSEGGDGDPLDVVLLSPAVKRGELVQVRPIGVLRMIDSGEQDDKIIAVPLSGPLSGIADLATLDRSFPGVTESLIIWFANYKGGRTTTHGIDDEDIAWAIIEAAAEAYGGAESGISGRAIRSRGVR